MSATSTLRKSKWTSSKWRKGSFPTVGPVHTWRCLLKETWSAPERERADVAQKRNQQSWPTLAALLSEVLLHPALTDWAPALVVPTTCALPSHDKSGESRDRNAKLRWHSRALWGGHCLKQGENNIEYCWAAVGDIDHKYWGWGENIPL